MRLALVTMLMSGLLTSSYVTSVEHEKAALSQDVEVELSESDVPHERGRRFVISAIWTGLGLVKEFSDRVTAVKGVISQVKSWLGIGDAPGTPPPDLQDVLDEIETLKTHVTDIKDDILAGQEWSFVLSVMGGTLRDLRTLVYQEEDYLEKVKDSSLNDGAKKIAQQWFFVTEANRDSCSIQRELAALQNGILTGTGDITKPLYEAYADKVGQQSTGTIFDLAKFISEIQEMQAHVYAIMSEGLDYKGITSNEITQERSLITVDVEQVKPVQTPKIAEAINIVMAHRGSSAYGRIKAKNNPHRGKCLKRREYSTVSGDAYVYLATCSETDESHQWQLSEEGHIVPKSHTDQAMRFEAPGSQNWQCKSSSSPGAILYPQPRVGTKTSSSTKFQFQFSTADFTIFQIKSGSNCLTTYRGSSTAGLTCTKPCAAITSTSGDTWFVWEPKEES